MKLNFHNVYLIIENNVFIICFALILLLLTINYNVLIIFYIIYLIYIYKKDINIFKIIIIVSLLILLIYFVINYYQNLLIKKYNINEFINIKGKVIDIEQKQYYQKITIRYNLFKVIVDDYSFNSNVKLGHVINVMGINKEIDVNHIPYGFNYSEYFYNNLYVWEIKTEQIEIIKKEISIYSLSNIVEVYLSHFFTGDSLIVLKGFIVGDTTDFSDELNNALKVNGIIHLFAISGSHITLLIEVFSYILNKTKVKNKNKILNIVLGLYLLITKFSVSISRAVITYYVNQLCKYKKIKFSSLDISCIVFIMFIIINPYFMYNLGFVLSFLSTFLIILLSDYLKKINNIKSIFIITLMINIFTLPLTININNEINILSPIINIIMISLVEGMIIPISFIVAVLPILKFGYTYIISGFLLLNDKISEISYKSGLVIVVGDVSLVIVILYYLLLLLIILFLKNKRIIKILFISFLFTLFLILFNIKIKTSPTITFLDLYNGESTLIEFNNETILIDTGEGKNNEVTSFLKAKGIRKLDYLILTHNHYDHNGEAYNIINTFEVRNIVLNIYDNSEFKNYSNVIFLKNDMTLKTKNIVFYCLSPEIKSNNENNNSLVLYFTIDNIKFLFLGDIEEEIEKTIPSLQVDVLKIAHHGSISSTSLSFLEKMKPQYCVIMSGIKNKFDFPNPIIIERIKKINSIPLTTKDKYTITLKIKKQKCIFKWIKDII